MQRTLSYACFRMWIECILFVGNNEDKFRFAGTSQTEQNVLMVIKLWLLNSNVDIIYSIASNPKSNMKASIVQYVELIEFCIYFCLGVSFLSLSLSRFVYSYSCERVLFSTEGDSIFACELLLMELGKLGFTWNRQLY